MLPGTFLLTLLHLPCGKLNQNQNQNETEIFGLWKIGITEIISVLWLVWYTEITFINRFHGQIGQIGTSSPHQLKIVLFPKLDALRLLMLNKQKVKQV